ncbi:MAG TPA: Xaa-Pro peptidase family protein [Firmicutes bacterium]|nr:Xaa-Pro peptidase family protein [Bacillota bacterium]
MNQDRLRRVIDNMHRQGLEQILVTATASVYYLTGVWVEPLERLLALYLDDTGRCVLFGNALFGLEEGDGLTVLTHTDSDDPVAQIAQTVRPGKLGIDKFWASRFLIGLMEQRRDITPVVGSAPVDDARMLKDAQEIEAMVAASRINDQVMAIASAAVKDGATEEELAALVERTFREKGADRSSEGQLVCFGPNGADPHHAPNRTVIARGDTVVFDIFIPIHRYWCDMTRTFFFREASDEGRRVYEAVKAANLAAEALIRPGLPMRDFDRAARKVIEDAGYGPYFTHRLGHGAGLDCHEPPDNSSANHTIAQPGMVFSVEPGIYLPGKLGVRIEDLVLVTEDGCRVLNAFSKELTIL